MELTDIAIIGAGVVGLAVASELAGQGKDVLVIERHEKFGQETSSRNSEVIHCGIYYPKGSLKTELCIRGRELIYDTCKRYKIPHKKLGKILLSTDDKESAKIKNIYDNAIACGVTSLRYLSMDELCKMEPDVKAAQAILCPDTGILDTHGFMNHLYTNAKGKDTEFAFGVEVFAIEKSKDGYLVHVREPGGESFSFATRMIINCAGLYADKVAAMAGMDIENAGYKIHLCKGQYFRIANTKKFSITRLLYPPPTDHSLGIHVTPDLGGGFRLGPDVGYTGTIDYKVRESDREHFYNDVKKYIPKLELSDLVSDTAGIRPKLHGEDRTFADFIIRHEADRGLPGVINAVGIESPGFTASLAIAEYIKKIISGW